ncbi:MAG: phosphoadenylyl-sulfate reductase [Actinomycetota bacterium]|nr:phosphoadenylyl-sulfate reductase [Actinomycetota bacterium]
MTYEELARQAGDALEGAHPREVLAWAVDTFGDRFCITSSMTDAVLAHLAASVRPGVDLVFLDTGYHFFPTIETRDRVAALLDVNVVTVHPERTVAQQNADLGMSLYARDPDLCCALRKVAPLNQALEPYDAWASGVRRDEGPSRRNTRVVDWDRIKGKVKVNPLACWTQADVDAYIAEHDIIVNPLVAQGFPSVGCAPCTRWVAPGEDARSGRWAGLTKTECGIHQ